MRLSTTRNFCVIAHIDHGKSTLADRLIEATGAVETRLLSEQHLDTLEIERERGITIKSQAMRMVWRFNDKEYVLNLIDTPGHVDFGYEVSRSMAACEGALLVVDATQGVEAQTVANTNLAVENGLQIIPVINKVDLDAAEPGQVADEIGAMFAIPPEQAIMVSAKTGAGISDLLEAIVTRLNPPEGLPQAPLRALVFDYKYDTYKGVIAYVRVKDGEVRAGMKVKLMRSGMEFEVLETGWFRPHPQPVNGLSAGMIGYVATGIKQVAEVGVGDTLTTSVRPASTALAGYKPRQPVVFTGIYPLDGNHYPDLRDALGKLQLNDASLRFEPENSSALGFGFRCGFLGMLHWEVTQERLEREFGLELIATAPNVRHSVELTDGTVVQVDGPSKLPPTERIATVREPWVGITVVVSAGYVGAVMELLARARGEHVDIQYLQGAQTRVVVKYNMPMAELLVDFHDRLKSVSSGYASMDYRQIGERDADLVKLDILVNHDKVDALALLTSRERAAPLGKAIVAQLKTAIPRQLFEIPLQAAIGARIVARDNIKALRKNVTAKCYGGDVTRKRKLLDKQAAGKKRMKKVGKVSVPQEAFMAVLKVKRGARS